MFSCHKTFFWEFQLQYNEVLKMTILTFALMLLFAEGVSWYQIFTTQLLWFKKFMISISVEILAGENYAMFIFLYKYTKYTGM